MVEKVLLISVHGDPLAPLGSIQAGGQNNYVKQLMYSLSEKQCKVDVLTHWSNPNDPPIEVINSNLRVIRISAKRLKYIPKDNMYDMLHDFYQEVKSRINLDSYDIMHTNYWLSGILGYVIKKDFNLPWTHTSHSLGRVKANVTGKLNKLRIQAEKVIFSNADSIIATTNNEKQVIINSYDIATKVKVIPIGVDPIFFSSTNDSLIEGNYFLYIGRLSRNKGILTLIDAFRKMRIKATEDIKLVIVGGGDKATGEFKIPNEVKASIKGLENHINFTGGLPQANLVNIFSNAIATIVPSYYDSFGMVAAEAQATGVPVLATKVGGLQEVVKNEVTGYLFENKDSEHLSTLMLCVLENHEVRKVLGKQAKVFAEKSFNWSEITEQMLLLYKELAYNNATTTSYANIQSFVIETIAQSSLSNSV